MIAGLIPRVHLDTITIDVTKTNGTPVDLKAFQPRNRRLPAQTTPAFVSTAGQPWWNTDGSPLDATWHIFEWGSVSTKWTVAREGADFILVSDRGMYLRWPNDKRGRKGRVRLFKNRLAAADFAEAGKELIA